MIQRERERFFILDGHSLAYRAFFALPLELTTREGLHTNAVLGFTNMLLRLLKDESPPYLVVAFDYPAPTFRHSLYEEYKATREKTPVEMSEQMPLIKEILDGFRIPFFELEGFEADDLIGTFVRMAQEANLSPVIVTADADAYQLLEPGVEILITRRGISQVERYDGEKLEADFGLTPRQWIDFKALKGDSSDNIPGVPGVGEKRALQLLHDYGSLEEVLQRSGEIRGKMGQNIANCADQALLGKELVKINMHVPISFNPLECSYGGPDGDILLPVLKRLEMNNIIKNLEQTGLLKKADSANGKKGEDLAQTSLFADEKPGRSAAEQNSVPIGEYIPPLPYFVESRDDLDKLLLHIEQEDTFTLLLHPHPSPKRPGVSGLLLSPGGGKTVYLPLKSGAPQLQEFWETFETLLQDPQKTLITYDYKPLFKHFMERKIEPTCTVFDTLLAAYLLEPDRASYSLRSLCSEHGGYSFPQNKREGHGEAGTRQRELELSILACCCSELLSLKEKLINALQQQELLELFNELELPLVSVLARMEIRGIKVKEEVLSRLNTEFKEHLASLEQEIMELAGEHFNINSPKQLSTVLFDKLALPTMRRIKTGYSTDARALQELAAHHPIAAKLVQYRTISKLINTYLDGLRPLINPLTGKIHTTFNQAVTATGRLSSRDPNLQNIPTRFDEGRRLREAFTVSREGNLLLAADYSQIELRIMAHLSGDGELVDAFRKDQDVHTRTAAGVFGVKMNAVTTPMRSAAKAVNFGIIYGISDYGLAQNLQISRKEAKQYIKEYFNRYSGINDYMRNCIEMAREKGYVTTLMGRRRYIPDINHPNHNRRSFAERVARNTPIQGSAADIIKVAMVNIERAMTEAGFEAMMLLQVHDELIFELPPAEMAAAAKMVKQLMEDVLPLSVPLKVDLKSGGDWYHLYPLERKWSDA